MFNGRIDMDDIMEVETRIQGASRTLRVLLLTRDFAIVVTYNPALFFVTRRITGDSRCVPSELYPYAS